MLKVVRIFTAYLALLAFTWNASVQAQIISPAPDISSPANFVNLSRSFTIPSDLGSVQETSVADEKAPFIIYIQDAHAVIDAQRKIEGMINYLQDKFGMDLVLMEGGDGRMDPTLWRAFPDDFIKRRVLGEFLSRGEMTGAGMSAVLGKKGGTYLGIEDWKLYEKNYFAYLKASENSGPLLDKLAAARKNLDTQRAQAWTPEMNAFFEKADAFWQDQLGLPELLTFLNKHFPGGAGNSEKYPQLSALLQSLPQGEDAQTDTLSSSISTLARQFEARYKTRLSREQTLKLHEYGQAYLTGSMDDAAYLKFIVETGKAIGVQAKLTAEMKQLLGVSQKLSAIRGTKLYEELGARLDEISASLAPETEARKIWEAFGQLRLLQDLVHLEVPREDLEKYEAARDSYDRFFGEEKQKIEAALEYYRVAMERDAVFHKKLEQTLRREKKAGAIVLSGGFHAKGFREMLQRSGMSYAVVVPRIESLSGEEHYEDLMKGKFSYKKYFKNDFYDAFARGSSAQLMERLSEPEFKRVLKLWRDTLIRNLADEGRLDQAGDYLVYLDSLYSLYHDKFGGNAEALTQERLIKVMKSELKADASEKLNFVWKKFRGQLDQLKDGLAGLKNQNNVTEKSVASLVNSISASQKTTFLQIEANNGLIPGQHPSRDLIGFFKGYAAIAVKPSVLVTTPSASPAATPISPAELKKISGVLGGVAGADKLPAAVRSELRAALDHILKSAAGSNENLNVFHKDDGTVTIEIMSDTDEPIQIYDFISGGEGSFGKVAIKRQDGKYYVMKFIELPNTPVADRTSMPQRNSPGFGEIADVRNPAGRAGELFTPAAPALNAASGISANLEPTGSQVGRQILADLDATGVRPILDDPEATGVFMQGPKFKEEIAPSSAALQNAGRKTMLMRAHLILRLAQERGGGQLSLPTPLGIGDYTSQTSNGERSAGRYLAMSNPEGQTLLDHQKQNILNFNERLQVYSVWAKAIEDVINVAGIAPQDIKRENVIAKISPGENNKLQIQLTLIDPDGYLPFDSEDVQRFIPEDVPANDALRLPNGRGWFDGGFMQTASTSFFPMAGDNDYPFLHKLLELQDTDPPANPKAVIALRKLFFGFSTFSQFFKNIYPFVFNDESLTKMKSGLKVYTGQHEAKYPTLFPEENQAEAQNIISEIRALEKFDFLETYNERTGQSLKFEGLKFDDKELQKMMGEYAPERFQALQNLLQKLTVLSEGGEGRSELREAAKSPRIIENPLGELAPSAQNQILEMFSRNLGVDQIIRSLSASARADLHSGLEADLRKAAEQFAAGVKTEIAARRARGDFKSLDDFVTSQAFAGFLAGLMPRIYSELNISQDADPQGRLAERLINRIMGDLTGLAANATQSASLASEQISPAGGKLLDALSVDQIQALLAESQQALGIQVPGGFKTSTLSNRPLILSASFIGENGAAALSALPGQSALAVTYEIASPQLQIAQAVRQIFRELLMIGYNAGKPVNLNRLGARFDQPLVIETTAAPYAEMTKEQRERILPEGLSTDPNQVRAAGLSAPQFVKLVELILGSEFRSKLIYNKDAVLPVLTPEVFNSFINLLNRLAETQAARKAVEAAA